MDFTVAQFGPTETQSAATSCVRCGDAVMAPRWVALAGAECEQCATRGPKPFVRERRALFNGALFGLAAAVFYAMSMAWAEGEFAPVIFLIGYATALGVQRGSGKEGGRSFQVMAAALTYLFTALAYFPNMLVHGAAESGDLPSVFIWPLLVFTVPFDSVFGPFTLLILVIAMIIAWQMLAAPVQDSLQMSVAKAADTSCPQCGKAVHERFKACPSCGALVHRTQLLEIEQSIEVLTSNELAPEARRRLEEMIALVPKTSTQAATLRERIVKLGGHAVLSEDAVERSRAFVAFALLALVMIGRTIVKIFLKYVLD